MSNGGLEKAEQRISELGNRSGEITPPAAWEDKERENMAEKLRGMEGRMRGSELPLQGVAEGEE